MTEPSRLYPTLRQFDYITLEDLRESIRGVAGLIGGRVLDYGCGTTPYASLFAHCTTYEGADFAGNPRARWTLDERGLLPETLGGAFDAVVSFQVLEHVPEVGRYLDECRRVLRPGGHLVITTHGIWEYHPGPRDLRRWTMEGLVTDVEAHGFQTDCCEAISTRLRSLLQQFQLLLRHSGRALRGPAVVGINLASGLWRRHARRPTDYTSLALCYLYVGRRVG